MRLGCDGLLTEPPRNAKGRTAFNRVPEDCEAVAKPELGTKRLCAHCGAKFYDLNHAPIACPKCGTVFEAVPVSRGLARKPRARRCARSRPAVAETQEAEFVSLEEADAEAQGKKKPGEAAEAEDEVELDDESLDDAAFIEESEEEDTDVTEIIGGDIENEEET